MYFTNINVADDYDHQRNHNDDGGKGRGLDLDLAPFSVTTVCEEPRAPRLLETDTYVHLRH